MMIVNLPDVGAAVSAAFARHEDAPFNNKIEALDKLFGNSPHAAR